MADKRESFSVLENGSEEGSALRQVVAGDSSAAKNGLIGFSFKDSNGNVVLPQLDSEGKLPVTMDGAGIPVSGNSATPVAGSTSITLVCETTLVASKTYNKISASGSCFKDAIYEVIQLDDVTETIIGHFIVGAGQYTFTLNLGAKEITTGATGTQKLQLKSKNLGATSDFRGNIEAMQIAG